MARLPRNWQREVPQQRPKLLPANSDRFGPSVRGSAKAVSYIEWLRQSKGQLAFRTMLEADLRSAIDTANDLGHFFMLTEHMLRAAV